MRSGTIEIAIRQAVQEMHERGHAHQDDAVLRGGYAKFRSRLVEGRPGSGKTTLGLQFLIQGAELGETVQSALAEIERIKPDQVVFDSLSEIRLLSQGSLRYRRQVLALKSFFLLNNATVLLLDDLMLNMTISTYIRSARRHPHGAAQ